MQKKSSKVLEFDIVTIFPTQVENFVKEGIFRIAQKKELVNIRVHNLRNWTTDNHKTVDDRPFGGGAGMIMLVEPLFKAIKTLKKKNTKVIIMTPIGKVLNQKLVRKFSNLKCDHFIIICGHYEGIDYRVHKYLCDYEISIGDYVLSGGELPALILIDSVIRLLPGVLGNKNSAKEESFENSLLEYPNYSRPSNFNKWSVPTVLLSGNHKNIKKWREIQSLKITKKRRPDIVK